MSTFSISSVDVAVVGGGIVGLASAFQLLRKHPDIRLVVVEKEASIASHQTGHNSGVLHSGVYYTPGSLKATNCRAGKDAMIAFCDEEGIDYELCGKVIVATAQDELPILRNIYKRGIANGVDCELIGRERLRELEPHAAGIRAIHVPETGIVDYRVVSRRLAARIEAMGGEIVTGVEVNGLVHTGEAVVVQTTAGEIRARLFVNCAGLHSDRIARMSGTDPDVTIVPFRGEYYLLTESASTYCNNLIYPVPDPNFPFLGVHFTRRIDGRVDCGPNAVLAFAREGYTMGDIDVGDIGEVLRHHGFRRLALRYWRTGLAEMWRSVSKAAFVRALQRLVPDIRSEHLEPAPAGVRAQAVTADGQLLDDFRIDVADRAVHVLNAPSPAATSSLNIGRTVAAAIETRLSAFRRPSVAGHTPS
jgi:L-2-hydroxyglutarate oxidase LhgO